MRHFLLFTAFLTLLTLPSCQKDDDATSVNLDAQLAQVLDEASSGQGMAAFELPLSTQYGQIPQDPKNPLSEEKIHLGAMLFHETGLGLNPMHTGNMGNYSCASCHFAAAGFQAGRHQGIGDGGMGFGGNGEGRLLNPMYTPMQPDVQPIRTPAALNIAYQEAVLWNGRLGGVGVNVGTEAHWTPGTPIENNNLGYHGTETQAIAAMTVHRLDMSDSIFESLNYRTLFDEAFPVVPTSERYDKLHAGLAIAAYERSLLPNQAPFQNWLRGATSSMTEQEKQGAILFFGKAGCASCHNGPNLASMDFHAYGMKDLYECPEETFQADAS